MVQEVVIFVGSCPICQRGKRRVRACRGPAAQSVLHGYILCDECGSLWLEPGVQSPQITSDSSEKCLACPVCSLPLFDQQASWATVRDVQELGWQDRCVIDVADASGASEDLLEPEDVATDLDSPAPIDTYPSDSGYEKHSPAEQLDEVTPQLDLPDESAEPKPGC